MMGEFSFSHERTKYRYYFSKRKREKNISTMNLLEARVLVGMGVAAVAILGRAFYRQALFRSRFARIRCELPMQTQRALQKHRWHKLRHGMLKGVISERELELAFDAIRAAFSPQQVLLTFLSLDCRRRVSYCSLDAG